MRVDKNCISVEVFCQLQIMMNRLVIARRNCGGDNCCQWKMHLNSWYGLTNRDLIEIEMGVIHGYTIQIPNEQEIDQFDSAYFLVHRPSKPAFDF